MRTRITGARLLLPDGQVVQEPLIMEDAYFAQVGAGSAQKEWDAGGCLLLPGIVDLHGDAFEHLISPRAGAAMNRETAIWEAAGQMLANGITTGYFSLTYTWEPGSRDRDSYQAFMQAFKRVAPHLGLDARVHLRFEIFHLEGLEEVCTWLENGEVDLLSFNDHLSYYGEVAETPAGLARMAQRFGVEAQMVPEVLAQKESLRGRAYEGVKRLAAICRELNIPMASHDEEEEQVRNWYHDLGCSICEFPIREPIAALATELGDSVVTGAPNVLKGGSLYGRLSSQRLISLGMCDILASDYYYPAQLQAAYLLHRRQNQGLGEMWDLISHNPAQALGLRKRGGIAEGLRADFIALDDSQDGPPRVKATFVGGRMCQQRP